MNKLIIFAALIVNCHISSSFALPTYGKLVEGDIRLELGKSLASNTETNIWPNGVVPYIIDTTSAFTTTQLSTIRAAMDLITSKTGGCITFVAKTSAHANWIKIRSLDGCWSYIGNIKRGEQELSLQKGGCTYKGTTVHEFLHALGFWHEQNRPDRDNFVKISYENIQDGMADQFDKYTGKYFSTPYDYNSIMHYDETAFSKNGLKTITPLQAGIDLIPSYDKTDAQILSALDVQAIRARYQCTGATPSVAPTVPTTVRPAVTTTVRTTVRPTVAPTTQAPSSTCVNADPTCSYFTNSKDTYCSTTTNYILNSVNFRDACKALCGVCSAPVSACPDQWFCDQYRSSASIYCSTTGTVYSVNGIPFIQACPTLCNTCTKKDIAFSPLKFDLVQEPSL